MYLDEGRRIEAIQRGDLAGLGERMPLVLQTPGVEHEGVIGIGQFRRVQVRASEELRLAAGGREVERGGFPCLIQAQGLAAAVVAIADRLARIALRAGAGPLQRRLAQPGMAGAAEVIAGLGVVELPDLVEHLGGRGVGEVFAIAQGAGHVGDDLPVGAGRAGRGDGLGGQGQVALGVDHHPVGLGPERAGQEDVGVAVGLGVEKGVLGDHQFGGLQPADDRLAIGHAGHRVGADDPAGLHGAGGQVLEQGDGALAQARVQGAFRNPPGAFDEGAVGGGQQAALAGQAGPHVAHLAPAHGIGLAGQGEGTAAGAADLAGGQVQVAQGVGAPGAVGTLVQAHGPETGPFPGLADPARRGADVRLGQTCSGGHPCGIVVGEKGRHGCPALGMGGDEGVVQIALGVQQVQQAVEQQQIGARTQLQEEIGLLGGGGAPGIDDDQPGAALDPVQQTQEEDGMAVGHVGAADQEEVGAVEVVIGAGRTVGAEGLFVAGGGTGHAQAGIGFELVGADEAPRQLACQVLGLQRHLAGHIEGDGVGSVAIEDGAQALGGGGDGLLQPGLHRFVGAVVADIGLLHASAVHQCLVAGTALGAEAATVGGMVAIAADPGDPAVFHLHDDPAADAAVGADALEVGSGHGKDPSKTRKRKGAGRAPRREANTAPLS